MRRREFIILLGGAVTAWPLIARAQRLVTPVIGFLSAREASEAPQLLTAFRQGLKELGFVESLEHRDRISVRRKSKRPVACIGPADLVQRQVTVIVAVTTPAALAAKAATTTVPIVFQSWRRPGPDRARSQP